MTGLLLVGLAACAVATTEARASELLDQQQPIIDAGAPPLTIGGTFDQSIAQTVTSGTASPLTAVQLPVSCEAGDLFVDLQEATAAGPGGAVIASAFVPGSELPGGPWAEFRRISLWPPVAVGAGARFAIVLRSKGVCRIFQGPMGNPYPGGGAFARIGSSAGWTPLGARGDLPFQTVVSWDPFDGDASGARLEVRCFVDSVRE